MAYINESHIEEADIAYFVDTLGYTHLSGYGKNLLGRRTLEEVLLPERLQAALARLNPGIPEGSLAEAAKHISTARYGEDPTAANAAVYALLREGLELKWREGAEDKTARLQYIDYKEPERNDFVVVDQLSIAVPNSGGRTRRPDLLLYVNGIPLVMIELKAPHVPHRNGYDSNLQTYRAEIPQLFWYNLLVVVSNGAQTSLGAFSAGWEHFFGWPRLRDPAFQSDTSFPSGEVENPDHSVRGARRAEGASPANDQSLAGEDPANKPDTPLGESPAHEEALGGHPDRLSLVRLCAGLFAKKALPDYLENFVLYLNGSVKVIAKNHQYYGVNAAVARFTDPAADPRRLGVFWHTQGSGKSYSMIFYTRKIARKVPGDWSFLIITDRKDLDDQIYRNFRDSGTVRESKSQKANFYRPRSAKQLGEYLGSHRPFVFSLIHKFGVGKGKSPEVCSERSGWVVLVDEAHRSQYDDLAQNMRLALPEARFIAFTGTPLLRGEKTNQWFGPYVSEYNFAMSIYDQSTLPLYYSNSVPGVEISDEDFIGEAAAVLDEEGLNEEQRAKLDREFSRLVEVVKRPDRLREIARHIVDHYPDRLRCHTGEGELRPMKAMVVSYDKFTALRMHDYVQEAQEEAIKRLRKEKGQYKGTERGDLAAARLAFMKETKMAVVISQEGSDPEEAKKFAAEGLDITPHRKLMHGDPDTGKNIEDYFKDVNSPYRIVFVTAMWLTGFDAQAVSTLYLDKPMQGHTLMQAIARTNRVLEGKRNGLIIDYFGVLRHLKKALAAYAEGNQPYREQGEGEQPEQGLLPVEELSALYALLREAIAEARDWLLGQGCDMAVIVEQREKGFREIGLFDTYANTLLASDDLRRQFRLYVLSINELYDSARPGVAEEEDIRIWRDALDYLRRVVDMQLNSDEALSNARLRVREILDECVQSRGDLAGQGERYIINNAAEIKLSELDFARLREKLLGDPQPRIIMDGLRNFLERKMNQLLRQNRSRGRFLEQYEDIIERYNNGSLSTEEAVRELEGLVSNLSDEEERAARMGLSEEELAVFDLLRMDRDLTLAEQDKVKRAAQDLLHTLREQARELFITEWDKHNPSRERVVNAVQEILDADLPESYDKEAFDATVMRIMRHLIEKLGEDSDEDEGAGMVA